MPILAPETNLFPSSLLDDFTSLQSERGWWAVRTKSRMEKSLARQLRAMEVPFYLPLIPKTTAIGRRRVKSLVPLFGGYLFVYGNDDERTQVLATNRTAQTWPAPRV